ncbi:MAG TPA: hypothetical protein VK846_02170 [Candidatus Limnocylindria bacterium]|nr:hypothetical protein [Candidatus Limnocylindria bacterium]
MRGAYIQADWSDTAAGDVYSADDCTLGIYFYKYVDGELRLVRGQFLPMIDCRSNLVLGFAIVPERNYTAVMIRGLIRRVHQTYGFPRKYFLFEGGIWKRSKIIKGVEAKGDAVPFEETEMGLRSWVGFRHAKTARGKGKMERVIGLLQNRLEPYPGYVGRDEINDSYERVQKQLAEVRAGKATPEKYFLEESQWLVLIEKEIEEYNHEVQTGSIVGKSPLEAWDAYFTEELNHLDAPFEYLLANHRAPYLVTKNGIGIKFSGIQNRCWYRNEHTSKLIGEKVLVWYDPEAPEAITITDFQRQNPITIPRAEDAPGTTATPEMMAAAYASVKAQNSHALTVYRIIAPKFRRNILRRTVGLSDAIALDQQITEQRNAVTVKQKDKSRRFNSLRQAASAAGLALPGSAARSESTMQATSDLIELMQKRRQTERGQNE